MGVILKCSPNYNLFSSIHNDTKVTHASAVYVCARKFYCMYSVLSFRMKCAVRFLCSDNVRHVSTS